MQLAQLVEMIPPDTEDRVDTARQRFNGMVRAILREEMALRLSAPSTDASGSAKLETTTVPVRVQPGVPLIDGKPIQVTNVEPADIVLGRHRSALESLALGARASLSLIDALEASP